MLLFKRDELLDLNPKLFVPYVIACNISIICVSPFSFKRKIVLHSIVKRQEIW